jgi:hypothetical protein
VSARALVGASIAASVALVGTFLALGGSSYAPAKVRDPCKPRAWPQTNGLEQTAGQFTLSALDGTACQLHVSRETLVLALGSSAGRERFASDPRLQEAVRAGLLRAKCSRRPGGEPDPRREPALQRPRWPAWRRQGAASRGITEPDPVTSVTSFGAAMREDAPVKDDQRRSSDGRGT